jgi:hypothetical protein
MAGTLQLHPPQHNNCVNTPVQPNRRADLNCKSTLPDPRRMCYPLVVTMCKVSLLSCIQCFQAIR